ncbi:MAG: hypothetical protein WBB01_09785, partial [Phormidesmis sp.]
RYIGAALSGAAMLTFASSYVALAQIAPTQAEAPIVEQQPAVEQQTEAPTAIAPPDLPISVPPPFSPVVLGVTDLAADAETVIGIGHLRPQELSEPSADGVDWLQSVILPLYVSPGGEHWGWIYRGWLIPDGQGALAIGRDAGFAMIQTEENLYTFPVLEVRDDGWIQVQYTSVGSAWVHSSQLALGEPLVVERWEARLQAQESVYFLQSNKTQALRSEPEAAANMLGLVAADSLIEPLSFAGDWMQVRVTRPTANCRPLTGATVTEGWMRWRSSEEASLVWYSPSSRCAEVR